MNQPDTTLAGRAEQVLQDSWQEREAGKTFSVLGVHVVAAALSLACAVALIGLAPPERPLSLPLAVALLAGYALGGRVLIAVGAGYAVPTQLALVPMLVVLPPAVVPLLVIAGLVLSSLIDQLAERRFAFRPLLVAVGDAPYALGPAIVFVVLYAPDSGQPLLVACFVAAVAQCLFDHCTSAARERAIRGLRSQQQLAVMAQVWSVDFLLWPVGVALAIAVKEQPWSVLALVPLMLLLHRLVRERNQRLEQAQARLSELNAERERLERAVRRVGEAFASGHDLDALMAVTLQTAADATGATTGRFVMMRPGREPRVAEVSPAAGAPPCDRVTVTSADGVVGRIDISSADALTDAERALLRYLIEQALIAESHIELVHRLHDEAQTDELTGLANFRRLHRVLDEGVAVHAASAQPLSLLVLDLDRFKAVNDTYGHQAGDLVLRTVAFALRDTIRLGDLAARQGGEELAIVLPNTGLAAALSVANRAAAAIRAREIQVSASETITVTASFGVATLGLHATHKDALVRAADDALYAAKHLGRDQVQAADPSLAMGSA
jgi:diguanylate cyclase (GGDEF)-like protein